MHHKRNTAAQTLTAECKMQTDSQALLAVNSKYVRGINGFIIDKHYYRFYVKDVLLSTVLSLFASILRFTFLLISITLKL
jgi:hypothetical protein